MRILRQQIAKLDPTNRGIRLRGFKEESLDVRHKIVDDLMSQAGITHFIMENIFKGSQRSLTDMCVVTLDSNSCRESVLRQAEKSPANFKGPVPNDIKFDRAKSLFS